MKHLACTIGIKDANACKQTGAFWNPILRKCRTPRRIIHNNELFELDSNPLKHQEATHLADSYTAKGRQTFVKSFDGKKYHVYTGA